MQKKWKRLILDKLVKSTGSNVAKIIEIKVVFNYWQNLQTAKYELESFESDAVGDSLVTEFVGACVGTCDGTVVFCVWSFTVDRML